MTQTAERQTAERQASEVEFYKDRQWLDSVDLAKMENANASQPIGRIYELLRSAHKQGKRRLLEYGCGRGQRSIFYAKLGFEVVGFDIAPNQIENAKELAAKYGVEDQCTFVTQNAEELQFADGEFDLVVGLNILHHVQLPVALPELRRVMSEGGEALFVDSLATPKRDRLRQSRLVTWLIPICNEGTDDEHPLTPVEVGLLKSTFKTVRLEQFRVFALCSRAIGMMMFRRKRRVGKGFFFRVDRAMFRVMPFMRRLGDQVVVVAKN